MATFVSRVTFVRVRWWLTRLAVAAIAALLAFKLGDMAIGWTRDTATMHRLRLVPHAQMRHQSDEFDYIFRTNSLGLRGEEFPLARTPGTWRIAVVGDSLVAGYGVANDDLLTARLQQRLTSRLKVAGDPRIVEVINVGRSGSSTIRELDIYQSVVRRWQPDVIVLAYFLGNDLAEVVEEADEQELSQWHPPGAVRRLAYGGFPNLYLELAMLKQASQDHEQRSERSAESVLTALRETAAARGVDPAVAALHYQQLPAAIRGAVESGRLQPWRVFHACWEPERFRHAIDPDQAFFDKAWPRTTRHLERFQELARADGARFTLAILPAGCQVDTAVRDNDRLLGYDVDDDWLQRSGRTQTALTDWCASHDTPLIDLTNSFRHRSQPLYFPLDGHFNPAGQDLAAEQLAEFLLPPADQTSP